MDIEKVPFTLQWHITDLCDQRCIHCYSVNSPNYTQLLRDELSFEQCLEVIDSLVEFCTIANAEPRIVFTGGDPLLRDDFFEILGYANAKGIKPKILGNPFHINIETISRLKSLGVSLYQLSIDGMEQIHDSLRQKGSFKATCNAAKLLEDNGIAVGLMYTLSHFNKEDLLSTMEFAANLNVHRFNFARLVPEYNQLNGELFSPLEYKSFLYDVQQKIEKITREKSITQFGYKDNLWALFFYERGDFVPPKINKNEIYMGCGMGGRTLSILSDGKVYACRRFSSKVGKVPDETILDIYISDDLDKYRSLNNYVKCRKCDLGSFCRGCPAVAFSNSKGSCFSPDPQCWKDIQ